MKLKSLTKSERNRLQELHRFYNRLYGVFHQSRTKKLNYYPCIPINPSIIFALATLKKNFPDKRKFLDVGAGCGHVVALADALGFYAHGIEVQQHSAMPVLCDAAVEYGRDAFSLTEEDLAPAQVIYTYQPIKNPQLCMDLYRHLIEKAQKGTIFINQGTLSSVVQRTPDNYAILDYSLTLFVK